MSGAPALSADVRNVIARYPATAQAHAETLRELIHAEATHLGVGPLHETLKWGQPAFLTHVSRSGTTLRLHWSPKADEILQMLVHCQTVLVDRWRGRFPDLQFEGNRALCLPLDTALPHDALRHMVGMALTYHRETAS